MAAGVSSRPGDTPRFDEELSMGGGGYDGGTPQPDFERLGLTAPLVYGSSERRLQKLEQEILELKAQAARRDEFSQWIDKATAYQTTVMAIAYAGFFVLWEKVSGVGAAWLHSMAGLLIGLSLFVYVFWTLAQMHGVHVHAIGGRPRPTMEWLESKGPAVFAFSALTGIAAGALIVGAWFYRFFI
jgi:hypothetical protein